MPRKPRRPKAITVGARVKVRAIRGPHKDGSGRWYWRAEAYDPTTQKRHTVWTGWGLLRDVEATVAAIVAEGSDLTQRAIVTEIRTVRDLLECWVWHVENVGGRKGPVAPNTLRIYTGSARHLITGLGDVRLDRLGGPQLEAHRDARFRGGAAPTTIRNEIDVIGFAWRWWMDRSPRPLKPLPKVEVRGGPVRNRYTPTRGEVLAVLGQLEGWHRIAVLLLYASGARPGEIRDLRWREVDLERRRLVVDGKTGPRPVPLAAEVVAELRRWASERGAEPSARVLLGSPSTFDSYLGVHRLRAACEAAGVPRFTLYGLRRAAVDAMARAGVDVATAAAVTGHSPTVMLTHYRTVTEEDRRRAIEVAGLGSLSAPRVIPFKRREG